MARELGTEVGSQPNVASSSNPGGSWKPEYVDRTKGHAVYGPCENPMHQEARDTNFADIVTLPIMPEPKPNPQYTITQALTMSNFGFYQLKDRILGNIFSYNFYLNLLKLFFKLSKIFD